MYCELCKICVVILSIFPQISFGRPGIYDAHGLEPGAYSGGGGNTYASEHYKMLASYAAPGEGLGNYQGDHQQEENSDGGDYHHGVSVVSLGNQQKGPVFDLTKHGGGNQHEIYGGSFIASGKYESNDSGGHPVEIHENAGHYDEEAASLAASLSNSYSH